MPGEKCAPLFTLEEVVKLSERSETWPKSQRRTFLLVSAAIFAAVSFC